jgi:AcrR family transcriptional regulator
MQYAVKSMPRPRSLSETDIAAAALAVIDSDGLGALSMRAVGERLGMATMSLYRYVSDRAQLEGLVVAHVLAGVDLTPPRRGPWTRQIAVLLERVREAVARHPEVVPLTMTHRHAAPGTVRLGEALLGVLTPAGFTGEARVIALRSLLSYLTGAIQLEHFGPLSGAGTDALAALPHEQFPLLAETARHARQVSAADEFRRGLDVLLAGLAAALV